MFRRQNTLDVDVMVQYLLLQYRVFLALTLCCWTPVAAARERDVTPLEHLGGRSNMATGVMRFLVSVGGAYMNINEFIHEFQFTLLDSQQV